MVKDFVPARTSVATGIVVKQHLLERQKYPTPQAEYTQPEYTASIGSTPTLVDGARQFTHTTEFESIPIETITGSDGGAFGTLPTTISASNNGGPITSISLNNGGSKYTGPLSNYSIIASGGGGSGFVGSISSIDYGVSLRSSQNTGITSGPNTGFNNGTFRFTTISTNTGILVDFTIVVAGGGYDPNTGIQLNGSGVAPIEDFDGATFSLDVNTRIDAGMTGTSDIDIVVTLTTALTYTTSSGVISGISIDNGGSNYTSFPELEIQGTPGVGAQASVSSINFDYTLTPVQSTQSFEETIPTPLGLATIVQDDSRELIDGEFGGSSIKVTDGDLTDYNIVPTLIYNQQGSNQGDQPINFSFNNDKNYLLEISATNNTGFSTAAFQIEDTTDPSYRLFTSPQIPDGDTFDTVISIEEFTINGKDLLTPNLTFSPVFFAGDGFDIIVNIRENVAEDGALPLLNNAITDTKSKLFYDVDYSDNIIQAVNQDVLISSSQQGATSATFAEIQDYNYYIDRSLTLRYKGSKSTSPGFNKSSSEGGLGILPNVEQLNVAAYSINWAGGTSPEILGAGGTSLSDILLVGDNRDDITLIPQADPNYSDTINSSVEPGDIVSFYQYGNSSAQNPQRVEVIETKLNVPPKSAYMISSQDSDDLAEWTASFFDGNGGIKFVGNSVGVYKVNTNDSGFYITGSFITASDFIPEFQERFNNSENDWYVSLYTSLPSPVIYNGPNATTNYEFTPNFTTSDPLGYYGVSKIIGVKTAGGGTAAGIYLDRNIGVDNGDQIGTLYGILIWESWGNSIIVRGSNLSGIGASLVYSEFAPKTLTNNLDYISQTYTNKS